jgi:peptidylprolyl isomerase
MSGESIQVTDEVRGNGRRDNQAGETGQSNASRIRTAQPKAGAAAEKAGTGTKISSATKAASGPKTSTGPKISTGPTVSRPATPPKGGDPQPLTKAEKRTLAKQRKARLAAARKRRKAMTGALIGLAVVVVIAGGVFLINHFNHGNSSTTAEASASATGSAAEISPTPNVPFPPTPAGADPALATKPTVATPSGSVSALKVTTLIQGSGAEVKSGQTITVNYVGVAFKDGKEFDSSWSRSQAFTTAIGQGGVIKGWDQGLVGVKVGSRVQLDIPSALAYGDNPTGGQPPGALRFVVDVLSAS